MFLISYSLFTIIQTDNAENYSYLTEKCPAILACHLNFVNFFVIKYRKVLQCWPSHDIILRNYLTPNAIDLEN